MFSFLTHIVFVIFGQITQQIFVPKEWYHDTRKQANAEALTCADIEKTLGAIKQKQFELTEKLKEVNSTRSSAEARLKTAERQAEDQHQKLHLTEIDLATKRQLVLDLTAELQKPRQKLSWPGKQPRRRRELYISLVWRKRK